MNLAPYTFSHGERFGKLTVLRMGKKTRQSPRKVIVGCACGHIFPARASHLKSGRVKSCPQCAAG